MAMNDVIVVLAHGGWADGSSWARVITGLAAHRIKVVAAPQATNCTRQRSNCKQRRI